MELYIVRHGETLWNREKRYYGHLDIGLSEYGLMQAKKLGRHFKNMEFNRVICSPLLRAVDTAKELTNYTIHMDDRLMEQNFGLFEGKTYQELMSEFPEELDAWNNDYQSFCIPGGESFAQVRNRVDSFVKELWEMEGKVLLVAHKGTFGHMLASLLGLPLSSYWNFVFEQGTFSRIDLEDGFAILRTINQITAE